MRTTVFTIAMTATALAASGRAEAATIIVDDPGDWNQPSGGSDCHTLVDYDELKACSLREAILASNWDHDTDRCKGDGAYGADTIVFALETSLIRVIGTDGFPVVEGPLEILGAGITISGDAGGDGKADAAIFRVASTGDLVLDDMTLRDAGLSSCGVTGGGAALRVVAGGTATVTSVSFIDNGSASWNEPQFRPGAIINAGVVEVAASYFEHNGGMNGAVVNSGAMSIRKSTFVDNLSVGWKAWPGGAIFGDLKSVTDIEDSEFYTNATDNWGGAIHVQYATLTIRDSHFESNYAGYFDPSSGIPESYWDEGPYRGGAISIGGLSEAEIDRCTFAGNIAGEGGAVYTGTASTAITRSTFEDNHAVLGGAIVGSGDAAHAELAVRTSLFSKNGAEAEGGGIAVVGGNLYVANSTFHANTAARGGGVDVGEETDGTSLLLHVTMSNNKADEGGGLYTAIATTLGNSIIANSSGGDCAGASSLAGYTNLVEDSSCGFSGGVDPMLEPLGDNGGPTKTMAIPQDSPAYETAHDAVCSDLGDMVDQRGAKRPWNKHCDIGAFEFRLGDPML